MNKASAYRMFLAFQVYKRHDVCIRKSGIYHSAAVGVHGPGGRIPGKFVGAKPGGYPPQVIGETIFLENYFIKIVLNRLEVEWRLG